MKGSDRVKARWSRDNHELFIELCLEQVSKGNKPKSHLSPEGWRNLVDSFHSANLKYDRIQLKNHWDDTKKRWKVWHDLVSDERMKWDPDLRSFGADELDWDEYLQENPEAAQFQFSELQYADKLDILYAGTESSSLTEGPKHRKRVNCFTAAEPISQKGKKEAPPSVSNERYLLMEEPIDAKPKVGHCYDAFESRSGITEQSPTSTFNYSIEECINELDSMEEIEQGGELYFFALDMFTRKEYREIFLNLKKRMTKIAWLKRLHMVGPPFPSN